jgi:hypothetical protein
VRTRAGLPGLLVAACSLFVLTAPAAAVPAVGLTPANGLVLFDTSTPGTVSPRNVAGLGANETIRGIDVRPTTGEVFVSTVTTASAANSVVRTYTLDTNTGVATLVGATAAALAGAGDVPAGIDFNPTADRIRYVNTNDESARLNPSNGSLSGNDTDLTPAATTTIIAEAYDRNQAGATLTTLYAIDRNDSQLARQGGIDGSPSPNGGVITDLGALGINLSQTRDGGFDISVTGVAFAALTDAADNLSRLYTINLATGAATAVGVIGDGQTEIRSLTILDTDLDADGVAASADNCNSTANADQADLDGDGQGDVCDGDQDGDGITDAVEATLGTNARSADSDGDGRSDGSDACPTLAAATANGCPEAAASPAPAPALTFTIGGFPSRIALDRLRSRGVALTLEPNQGASFLVELRGRLRGSRLARAGDFVLAERRLSLASGRRSVRLRIPRSQRTRLRRRAILTLRVSATDASGRVTVQTRRLRIR